MSTVRGAKGGGAAELAHVQAGDMDGLDDVAYEVAAKARTLTSVLDEYHAPADFELLSLDVEGFEGDVLKGLDLVRYRPRYILVEMHDIEGLQPRIEAALGGHYEVAAQLSPTDLLYQRSQPNRRS